MKWYKVIGLGVCIFALQVSTHLKASATVEYDELLRQIKSLSMNMDFPASSIIAEASTLSEQAQTAKYPDLIYSADSIAAVTSAKIRQFETTKKLLNKHNNSPYTGLHSDAYARMLQADIIQSGFHGDEKRIELLTPSLLTFLQEQSIHQYVRGNIMVSLGNAYSYLQDYSNAVSWLKRSAAEFQKIEDEKIRRVSLLLVDRNMGNAYFYMGELDNAKHYYLDGLQHALSLNDINATQAFYYNLTLVFGDMKNWEEALRYAKLSANFAQSHNDWNTQGNSLSLAARSYLNMKQYDNAIDIELQSIEVLERSGDTSSLFASYSFMSEIYVKSGQPENALVYLKKAQALDHHYEGADRDVDYLQTQYLVLAGVKDYERAYQALMRYKDVIVENFQKRQDAEAQKLMVEYDLEITRAKEKALESDNALQAQTILQKEQQVLSQRLLIGLSLLLLIVVCSMLFRERQVRIKIHNMAMTDPLTGAPNRRSIEHTALNLISDSRDKRSTIGLAILDIDHFKRINDTYGHDAGDAVLIDFYKTCRSCLRDTDVVGRFGGEEFLMLLPGADKADIERVFARLQQALFDNPTQINGEKICVTVSMGASSSVSQQENLHQGNLKDVFARMVKQADEQVYIAKNGGRNRLSLAA